VPELPEVDPDVRGLPDLFGERVDYLGDHLLETAVPADPFPLFSSWLSDAFAAKERGVLPEPTAMVVSTTADGRPSSRTVLLKDVGEGGFTFFTNYGSRKATEMARSPHVALLFGWYPLQRQVRIEGRAERVPRSESEAYFASRPRGSQLGAWASAQSAEVTLEELTAAYRQAERRFAGVDVPCPEHWGGYRVGPDIIEFWQGQPSRMHDRLVYRRSGNGWEIVRLAP
jgi:pyridoxamine 5'-phosphate oxidase